MNHISPFFSLPADEILARIKILEDPENSPPSHSVLRIRNHTELPWTGATWRDVITDSWSETLQELLPFLPDMDIAIFLHDGPMTMMDATAMAGYREAAAVGACSSEYRLFLKREHQAYLFYLF